VHLAALNENEAARSPEDAARLSVDATARLFESSKRAGARAFVFASTFHVYGAPPGAVIDESTPPSPAHPYGAAHLGGELRCHELHSDSCRAVILRISNVYGAPARLGVDRWTLAHNEFCTRAARREAIVFKSAGLQHRDFVWVEDVADAIDLALGPASMSAAPVVWNVGGENSRSVYSLATLVCERARTILGWSPPIERPEPAAGDREVPVRFSISRLRSAGYEPHDRLLEETDRLIGMLARRAN
jgi:UDP-glucose 4-epimerase